MGRKISIIFYTLPQRKHFKYAIIMNKKPSFLLLLILTLTCFSCKRSKSNKTINSIADSISVYNEPSNLQHKKKRPLCQHKTDTFKSKKTAHPDKTIFQNSQIDTTNLFGIWAEDPNGPHADFWLTAKSFYVVDYDGNGDMPYILDKNKISIFYDSLVVTGTITSSLIDTLIIKWSDIEIETKYVKFE